jgi:hypothetical protein
MKLELCSHLKSLCWGGHFLVFESFIAMYSQKIALRVSKRLCQQIILGKEQFETLLSTNNDIDVKMPFHP